MYLKSLTLKNFRKFRTEENTIDFVEANDYVSIKDKEDQKINIAPRTTLIIGKNNSGKTTVVEALIKLVSNTNFTASDFNFDYLKALLDQYTMKYLQSGEKKEVPTLEFVLTVVIDNNKQDLLTNIIPFMTIGDVKISEVQIIAKWCPRDNEVFFNSVQKFVENIEKYKEQKLDRFLTIINQSDFALTFFNINQEKREGFSLKKLIEIEPIAANKIRRDDCLSSAFAKIIDYRYNQIIKKGEPDNFERLDEEIVSINEKLTKHIEEEHTTSINSSLQTMISGEKCQVLLRSDLNFQTILKNVLKYEYIEGNNNIPEQQFGLGYTNLMMIVADIITYMERYPEDSFNSQINIISIEEPETFMHPQMQELFIKNINEMISSLLEGKNKHVNSQIIITTHSPHILNSKIHEGGTFNNINYITDNGNTAKSVVLSDRTVLDVPDEDSKEGQQIYNENLKFLSKHIKFKVSELFFSDAVIFVEGITEYTLLQYYINRDSRLNKHYVSLILIDGAHAKVYEKLIYILGVPTLIITDIDYKRENYERNKTDKNKPKEKLFYLQMNKAALAGRVITNTTLGHFYGTTIAEEIINGDYTIKNNLMVACQRQEINGFYPTSFEEAFILTNIGNEMTKKTLETVKPQIYGEVIKEGGLACNSFKLQSKLSNSKSEFANELLYNILISDDEGVPVLPNYISDGLDFIVNRLGGKEQ